MERERAIEWERERGKEGGEGQREIERWRE